MSELVLPTTRFFREPSGMTTIVKNLAPRFGDTVRVAAVGCSTGEEVYSLLHYNELANTGVNLLVDGYDYNRASLRIARRGRYLLGAANAQDQYRAAMHRSLLGESLPDEPREYQMPEHLRQKARFRFHDLEKGPLRTRYPIILLANVLYHYYGDRRDVSMAQLLDTIAASLYPRGFLVGEDIQDYQSSDRNRYLRELESHPSFEPIYSLGIPLAFKDKDSGDLRVDLARVYRKV